MRNFLFIALLMATTFQMQSQEQSIFSQGEWYEITTHNAEQVQVITYATLLEAGVNVESVDPDKMKLYLMPPELLPEIPGEQSGYPVNEMAIRITGSDDGSFDDGDKLLFYPARRWNWSFDEQEEVYIQKVHPYAEMTHYFLRVDGEEDGKRIESFPSLTGEPAQVLTHSDYQHGSEGAGDISVLQAGRDFMKHEIPDEPAQITFSRENTIITFSRENSMESSARLVASVAWGKTTSDSDLKMYLNDELLDTFTLEDFDFYKKDLLLSEEFAVSTGDELKISFESADTIARAFVDYMAVQGSDSISLSTSNTFQNSDQMQGDVVEYRFNSDFAPEVWDVTDPLSVVSRELLTSEPYAFRFSSDSIRTFAAFNLQQEEGIETVPSERIQQVDFTDLYALEPVEMLIITSEAFEDDVTALAGFHQQNDGLTTEIVTVSEIYNNFSGTVTDFSAIRNFIKHMYEKGEGTLKHVLLFGNASYQPNSYQCHVPTFQSEESLHIMQLDVGDVFFGVLDDGEDFSSKTADMDVNIGRLPVLTTYEAGLVMDKIQEYHSADSFGNWKTDFGVVADDEDNHVHMQQQETFSRWFNRQAPVYDMSRLYVDKYPQEDDGDHQTSPQARQAIKDKIEEGVFFMDYTGHAGSSGWAAEQIFTVEDALNLENDFYPFIVSNGIGDFHTGESTLGKALITAPNAAIGVLSTTAVAFSQQWNAFRNNFYFSMLAGENQTMGDIFRNAVNADNDYFHRNNYALLGDPALRLSYPDYEILTETINGEEAMMYNDTLMLGEEVAITASVNDNNGVVNTFNGEANVRVFAPGHVKQTLGTDSEPFEYVRTDSLIYETEATVENGVFEFSFALPEDYDFAPDSLKISYYASADNHDAAGYYDELMAVGEPSGLPHDEMSSFRVYPTLVTNVVNIRNKEDLTNTRVEIYNSNGNKVFEKMWPMRYGVEFSVNMESMAHGVYLIRLLNSNGVMTQRIVKK